MASLRSTGSNGSLALAVPRVRRAVPNVAPAAPGVATGEIDVVVELAPSSEAEPTLLCTSVRPIAPAVAVAPVAPVVAVAPAASYVPPQTFTETPGAFVLPTPSEGVTCPTRATHAASWAPPASSSADYLARLTQELPQVVSERLVTIAVATLSFVLLAAAVVSLGGNTPTDGAHSAAFTTSSESTRSVYTRPHVQKLYNGGSALEAPPPAVEQAPPPPRPVARANAAAAPRAQSPATSSATRTVGTIDTKSASARDDGDALPTTREAPGSAAAVPAKTISRAPAAAATPPATKAAASRTSPAPRGESSMAQQALDDARNEDTSLGGH
jgi:hypothetical protein